MKTIIINEKAEKSLIQRMVTENLDGESALIELVKNDLDTHYKGGYFDNVEGTKNNPSIVYFVKGQDGLPLTDHPKTKEAVFRTLQKDYADIKDGGKERDKFLWDIMTHWYNKNWQKHGGIPK